MAYAVEIVLADGESRATASRQSTTLYVFDNRLISKIHQRDEKLALKDLIRDILTLNPRGRRRDVQGVRLDAVERRLEEYRRTVLRTARRVLEHSRPEDIRVLAPDGIARTGCCEDVAQAVAFLASVKNPRINLVPKSVAPVPRSHAS